MRTFAEKPKATRQATPPKTTVPARSYLGHNHEVNSILHLQRTIGNQAVQRLQQSNAEERNNTLTGTISPHFGHDFSRIPIHPPAAGAIQTKLAINKPGDKYEQEADRVADKVMRMPEPNVRGSASARGKGRGSSCSPLSSFGGHSLDAIERLYYESRFGYDFSRVKIHDASSADSAARAIGARAFTLGNDIYFRSDVRSNTLEGRRTMAHELTHVIQQGSAAPQADTGNHSIAAHYSNSNSPVSHIQRTPGPRIQMDCEDDQRKCRNSMNWSDGGHWIGTGPEPDCNCDSSFSDTRTACRNRLNWSDGGHWIGSGAEPDCSLTRTGESRSTLIYLFPSNECVQQFNADRNAITTHLSTGAGIITGSVAATLTENPVPGIIAGAVVNELIGAIPQTPVGVGYRWVRVMTARYTRSAHPWGANHLTLGIESSVFNENDQLVEGFSSAHRFTNEETVRLGPLFVDQGDQSVTIPCPRGNMLSM